MTAPLAIFGIDVGDLVEDAVRALVDLVVPDFGSEWVSSLVTWLVALPPVTGGAFPSLNSYAEQLTAVGFGVLGACFLAGLLQLWAGGAAGATGAEAVRRAAIGAGALASYTTVLQALLVGVNILTAQMIRHPLVVDGLDKAFGESLTVAAVSGGVSLGLAIGAALALLFFVAALFVLKIGLTALLAVAVVAGALVWGLYPLPQAQWVTRAWISGLVAALAVPVAWACVFAAAALLARDTLVFEGGGQFNQPLGDTLGYLVKPFAAVACFWIAYRAPYFLLGVARTAGLGAAMLRPSGGGTGSGGAAARARQSARSVRTAADRFRAIVSAGPVRGAAMLTRQVQSGVGSAPTRLRTSGAPAARGDGRPTSEPSAGRRTAGEAATKARAPGDRRYPRPGAEPRRDPKPQRSLRSPSSPSRTTWPTFAKRLSTAAEGGAPAQPGPRSATRGTGKQVDQRRPPATPPASTRSTRSSRSPGQVTRSAASAARGSRGTRGATTPTRSAPAPHPRTRTTSTRAGSRADRAPSPPPQHADHDQTPRRPS